MASHHTAIRKSRSGSKGRRFPLVVWGGILLLVTLCTTVTLIQTANQSLRETNRFDPFRYATVVLDKDTPISGPSWQGDLRPSEEEEELIYNDDDIPTGILSNKPRQYFRSIQQEIDNQNLTERCNSYGFGMTPKPNSTDPRFPHRRIFYGSLIAEEPWELLEVVAAETHGVFEAMVFVEGNRTQTATPRKFKRTEKHLAKMQTLFGVQNIQIRRYVNEDTQMESMIREHRQRQEILKGWKGLGMTANDIGYIADADETFTRDFLRAIQTCPYVEALDYDTHHCFNPKVKIAGYTRMFESSPECMVKRTWYHPDMILGACIEMIGNETMNPLAPRVKDYLRAPGYAHNCETRNDKMYQNSFGKINGTQFPLWSAADFRRQCGGHNYELNAPNYSKHTAFHFHNFFHDFRDIRRKYATYGHAVFGAQRKRLEGLGDDVKLMVRCVRNQTDAPTSSNGNKQITETQQWQREVGGLEATLPPWPIYFIDKDYRQRRHTSLQEAVIKDERRRQGGFQMKRHEVEAERLIEEAKEAKRQAWMKEAEAQALKNKFAATTASS